MKRKMHRTSIVPILFFGVGTLNGSAMISVDHGYLAAGTISGSAALANAARIAPGNAAGTLTLNDNRQFLSSTETLAMACRTASSSSWAAIRVRVSLIL